MYCNGYKFMKVQGRDGSVLPDWNTNSALFSIFTSRLETLVATALPAAVKVAPNWTEASLKANSVPDAVVKVPDAVVTGKRDKMSAETSARLSLNDNVKLLTTQ